MAHRLGLGETGKADRLTAQSSEAIGGKRGVGKVDTGHVGAADLEEEAFLVVETAVTGDRVRRCVRFSGDGLRRTASSGRAFSQPMNADS